MKNNGKKILLNFVGDIMLGDSYHMLGIGVGSSISHEGPDHIFEKVSDIFKQSDLNIGNLECVFSLEEQNSNVNVKPYSMNSAHHIECLKNAGFQILSLANNHTMQYGKDVFQHTEQLLNNSDIKTVGSLNNPSQVVNCNGIEIAFLNYSLRPNNFNYTDLQYIEGNKDKILEDIAIFARQYDHTIVLLHWGDEYVDYPSKEQVCLAHGIIDAGATMIVGHHPHILQGVEYYNDGVIAYSLGNFVFDKPQKLQKKSAIMQTILSKTKIETTELIPVYINKNYQPEIASGTNKLDVQNVIERVNKKVTTIHNKPDNYHRDICMGTQNMRIQFYIYFLLNFYKYSPLTFLTLFRDAIKRKILRRN